MYGYQSVNASPEIRVNEIMPRTGRAAVDTPVNTLPTLSLSVLIVDDQPDVAESTAELLSLCGCQTQIAACGTEALGCVAAAAVPFDLVLLDLALSDVDGWEVARQLRKQTASKAAFFVAMTGYSSEEARCRSAEAGIDIHLVKPVPPQVLIRLLAWIRNILHPRDYV